MAEVFGPQVAKTSGNLPHDVVAILVTQTCPVLAPERGQFIRRGGVGLAFDRMSASRGLDLFDDLGRS